MTGFFFNLILKIITNNRFIEERIAFYWKKNFQKMKIYPTAQFPIPVDLGAAEKSQFLDCFHSFASIYLSK